MKDYSIKDVWLTVCAAAAVICAALIVIVVMTSCIDINNPFLELTKTKPREIPEPPPPPPPPPPEEGAPEIPRITVQPQGAIYTLDMAAAALTVGAEVDDEGTLSCQWYRSDTDSAEGWTAIDGAADWQYAPPTNKVGVTYYYAIITNTLNEKTAFVNSDTARIEIIDGNVTGIEIAQQPTLLKYTHGDALDLDGLAITISYDNGASEEVAFAAFTARNIATNPMHGMALSCVAHNGKTVEVSFARFTAETNKLTVNKAIPEITFPTASPLVYGAALSASTLSGGSVEAGSFRWANSQTIPIVNNGGYNVEFTPFDTENYDYTGITGWNGVTVTQNVKITVSPKIIDDANVSVRGPATGQSPSAWASVVGENYINNGSTAWSPNDPTFLGEVAYTATVTLWANANYVFAATAIGMINGNRERTEITANSGQQITLTYTFSPTDSRVETGFSLISAPTKPLIYTHNDLLDLTGLTVMFNYNDGTNDYVESADFESRNVGVNFAHNYQLKASDNGQTLTVSFGGMPIPVRTLTVYKLAGAAVSKPTVNTITSSSITINAANLLEATGQTIEYAISTTANENPANLTGQWTAGRLNFGGLFVNMTYYVYARSQENATYYAGEMSVLAVSLLSYTINMEPIVGGIGMTFTDYVTGAPMDTIVLYRSREPHAVRITVTSVPSGYSSRGFAYYYSINNNSYSYPLGNSAGTVIDVLNPIYTGSTLGYILDRPGRYYITYTATAINSSSEITPTISTRVEVVIYE